MNIALNGVALAVMQASTGEEPASGGLSALFSSTPWIDIVGLGIVAFFLIRGLTTGLIWQIALLVGVGISITVARKFAPEFSPKVQEITDLPLQACQGLVWFTVFAVTLIIAALLGKLGQKTLEAVQLGAMDRMGGALAGALTGAIVHCALLILLSAVGTTNWTDDMLEGSASAIPALPRMVPTVSPPATSRLARPNRSALGPRVRKATSWLKTAAERSIAAMTEARGARCTAAWKGMRNRAAHMGAASARAMPFFRGALIENSDIE